MTLPAPPAESTSPTSEPEGRSRFAAAPPREPVRPLPDPHGRRDAALLFFAALLVYWLTCPGATAYDQYSRLANAMVHGSLSLPQRPPHLEMAEYQGRAYFTNPPTPAVLLAPVIWIFQTEPLRTWLVKLNGGWELPFGWFQTGLSLFCGSLAVAYARIALGRVPVSRAAAVWGAILFGFGSVHWYHTTIGSVWYLAQIVHGMFMWMLVAEWFGKARPALMATYLGFAFWCRMETIVAAPFVLLSLSDRWLHPRADEIIPRPRIGWLIAFAVPLLAFLALNSGYNFARFGVFGNEAYEVLHAKDGGDPLYERGLLHWSYYERHVYGFFKAKPLFYDEYPWILSGVGGIAIWYTTPAFFYAFKAPWNRWTLACWAGILVFMAVLFQHGGTGMTQLGYRFALDFYAPLTVLTLSGMDRPLGPPDRPVIRRVAWIVSGLIGGFMMWFAPWERWTIFWWIGIVLFVGFLFDNRGPIRPWHVAFILLCVAINTWWTVSLNLLNLGRLF